MHPREALVTRALERLESAVIALPQNADLKRSSNGSSAENPPANLASGQVIPPSTPTYQTQLRSSKLFGFLQRRRVQKMGAA